MSTIHYLNTIHYLDTITQKAQKIKPFYLHFTPS